MSVSTDDKHLNGVDVASDSSTPHDHGFIQRPAKLPLGKRILSIIWDSLDKSPKERALIAKLDWFILSYVCIAYFVKYLDQTNVSSHS